MATDLDTERFIGDSFSSIWDLELLCELLDEPDHAVNPSALVERMRASEQVVTQGAQALAAAGIAMLDDQGRLIFQPVNDSVRDLAQAAREFYARFPGRTRRLIISRQAPGLTAFADAFRLRKDGQ